MGSRIIEKIERHIQLLKTHGKCVTETKKELKEKVNEQMHKVKMHVGWESESE